MIPEEIKREHIINAIEEIDEKGVPDKNKSKKYDLIWNDKAYPPKYTIALASKYAGCKEIEVKDFSGGREANDFLEKLEFEVKETTMKWKATVKDVIEEFCIETGNTQFTFDQLKNKKLDKIVEKTDSKDKDPENSLEKQLQILRDEKFIEYIDERETYRFTYDWLPLYKEISEELSKFRDNQSDLISLIREMKDKGYNTIKIMDEDEDGNEFPLEEIDPFTFFSNFNIRMKDDKRIKNLEYVKDKWNLDSDLPETFKGVPFVLPHSTWYFGYSFVREDSDIESLWNFYEKIISISEIDELDGSLFNSCLEVKYVAMSRLTQASYVVRPDIFIPFDKHLKKLMAKNNIEYGEESFADYREVLDKVSNFFDKKKFYEISNLGYYSEEESADKSLAPHAKDEMESYDSEDIEYWKIAPGRKAKFWEKYKQNGVIAVGWNPLGDVSDISKEEFDKKVNKLEEEKDWTPDALNQVWKFKNISIGDKIVANNGIDKVLGIGEVTGNYYYDNENNEQAHRLPVNWEFTGSISVQEGGWRRTLINLSEEKYKEIRDKAFGTESEIKTQNEQNYFWITANPKIWKVSEIENEGEVFYTAFNKKGNKRKIFGCFEKAKAGDKVIFYEASPIKAVVALGEVTKGLHKEKEEGHDDPVEGISIRYIKEVEPIKWGNLISLEELEDASAMKNRAQGSLFELTQEEYETILNLGGITPEIESKTWEPKEIVNIDTNKQFKLNDASILENSFLYFPDNIIDSLETQISSAIRNGKHIILTGPPGTGKSKLAKQICEFYTGCKENYKMSTATSDWSTFDTIGGYQPDSEGSLEFKPALFLKCFKDENGCCNKWLIIDEINRADIDKAFGSLFSALTGDRITLSFEKEGEEIEVIGDPKDDDKLEDHRFFIHPDWRIVATMNTFDKASLYEMSYAFMRRFAFVPVNVPGEIKKETIANYIECWDGDFDEGDQLCKDLCDIWKKINETRTIGPAIVEDIYNSVKDQNGEEEYDFTDELIMYVFPQFEGLMDEDIEKFIERLDEKNVDENKIKNFCSDFFQTEKFDQSPEDSG